MPVYSYVVHDEANRKQSGTIAGDSARHARQLLRDRGLQIVEVAEQNVAKSGEGIRALIPGKRNDSHLASFLGELATMLAVGVPMMESLDTLLFQYKGRFRDVILHLKDRIESGNSLAQAMKEQPAVFDKLCISMAEVGENAGNLDETLRQLADFKQRALLFKDKILSALLYPLIILTVSIAIAIFLMTFVIPMLLTNLVEAGRPLPWPTRILKSASDLLVQHGWLIAIASVVVVVILFMGRRTRRGKRLWDTWFLKIPLLGNLNRKQEIGRLALMISTLLKSGIEFVKTIEIAKGTTKNVLLDEALTECEQLVTRGKDIGHAFKQNTFFPPMVSQIFAVGQKSGRLDEMLSGLAADYDRQVESATTRLTATIEPVLILSLSVFVGFILFATILPILEAANAL